MKLRMYLRGLGIGMVVTAIVMAFGVKTDNNKMTDDQVRARAKELGMVEETGTLKDAIEETKVEEPVKEEKPETKVEEPVKEEKPETKAEEPVKEEKPETKVEEPVKEEKPETKAEKVEEKKPEEAKKPYNLRIEKGYSSDRVAKILEGAGVVNNAASFDKYLCSNGYDHRISVGTYQIPAGADFATIAKMITHSN